MRFRLALEATLFTDLGILIHFLAIGGFLFQNT
jgi:hypothetical protein